jgi:hypothetical protein
MDLSALRRSSKLATQRYCQRLARACADAVTHGALPGYGQLPRHTRAWLNLRALGGFVRSRECLRLVAYFTIWQLVAYSLVWHFDLRAQIGVIPPLLACTWLWPWLADARRRHIHRLLGGRWPS